MESRIDPVAATRRGALGSRYRRLWSAVTASSFGNGLTVTALALLVVSRTADPMAVAVLSALADAPALVVALVGGRAVDRHDRRQVLVAMDLVRGVLLAGLGIAVVAGWADVWIAYAVVLASGVASLTFDLAAQAMIPALVSGDRLHAANGWLYAAEDGMKELVGPPAGAALFAIAPALPFLVDAVTFGASGLVITSIGGRFPATEHDVSDSTTGSGSRAELRTVAQHPMWRVFAGCWTLVGVANGVAFATLVLFVTKTLGASALAYGLISAAVGVGLIAGGVVAERILTRLPAAMRIWGPILLTGLLYAAVGLAGSAVVAGLVLVAWGFGAALLNTAVAVLRQERIPQAVFGRAASLLNLCLRGGVVIGAIAGGFVATELGLRAPWLVAGAIEVGVALVAVKVLTIETR